MIIVKKKNGHTHTFVGDIDIVFFEGSMIFVDATKMTIDFDKTIDNMTHATFLLQTIDSVVGVDDVR